MYTFHFREAYQRPVMIVFYERTNNSGHQHRKVKHIKQKMRRWDCKKAQKKKVFIPVKVNLQTRLEMSLCMSFRKNEVCEVENLFWLVFLSH